ncbi:hypothetical protein D3Z45_00290 [Lachnospiraceae bacterium]|nr:hypothetical protein [Lachnospiraceae bacterium]
MAMRDEVREQQNKLKGKTFKEKLDYFWDYYKVHTIVLVFSIVVISVFVKDIVTSKDNAFSAVILNSYAQDAQEAFQADFAAYASIDTDTYNCLIDTSATYSVASMSQYDIAFAQRIAAQVQTGDLDAFVGDGQAFSHYADGYLFQDLREALTEEEYQKYEPYFYYIDTAAIEAKRQMEEEDISSSAQEEVSTDPMDPSSMETPVPVGICLESSSKLAQWNCYAASGEPPIFGFLANAAHPDLAHRFLAYLTEPATP